MMDEKMQDLYDRLDKANATLLELAQQYRDHPVQGLPTVERIKHLTAKAEGVRLARSYIDDYRRDAE